MVRLLGLVAALLLLGTLTLQAHTAQFTSLVVTVKPDGSFAASLNIDVLAFALREDSKTVQDADLAALLDGPRPALAAQLAEAGERFRREVVIRTEQGNVSAATWVLPNLTTVDEVLQRGIIPPTVMPGEIEFSGKLPARATTLAMRLPYVLGETIHIYQLPGGRQESGPVEAGAFFRTITLDATKPGTAESQWKVLGSYIGLGFEHIIPKGLDHILFVLGLFLLSARLRSLLWQVSAFTLAHSLTLALSIYGVISLPPSVVEPIIAASIVFIAIENVFTSKLHAWRPFVVFAFGLLHGLGFAGVLTELGLPNNAELTAIVGFNLGVEAGQLAVIILAFLAVGWFRNKAWYRRRIVVPASLIIAAVALYWTIERLLPSVGSENKQSQNVY
jgi:hydrogenase/urease accessory protein HupE